MLTLLLNYLPTFIIFVRLLNLHSVLAGDDTECNVRRLCFKAQNPVRKDLMDAMGVSDLGITCGAICVYSSRIPDAVKALRDARSSVPVASVAAGFPAGSYLIYSII